MPTIHVTRALRVAEEAARAGGEVLRSRRGDLGLVREKSAAVDVVTDADIAAGVAVVAAVSAVDGDARFIVEEDEVFGLTGARKAEDAQAGELWMIDPLDGTTSFLHGYPCYSVSVAYLVDGRPMAGAVYNASLDEMFSATRGGGATCDGTALRCSDVSELPRALLATGFPYDRGEPLRRQLPILGRIIESAHDLRRDGSAAIDCCHVAAGRCDGYWELALKPWDLAAGVLIAEESGASVTDFRGAPWTPATTEVVIANPTLHRLILGMVQEVDRAR